MNTQTSIVTSAADCCGQPSSIRPMDKLHRSNMEQKESFMFSNRSSVSRGCSLAAKAVVAGAALAIAVGTGLFTAANAQAATIYQDSFNRTGGLNGSSPTIDTGGFGGTAGATWSAINFDTGAGDTGWATSTTGGGQLTYSGNPSSPAYDATAWLPFTPQSGEVYTAQATIVGNANGGSASNWWGFFFDNSSSGLFGAVDYPWMLDRIDPSTSTHIDAAFTAGGVKGSVNGPTAGSTTSTSDTTVNTMILNTTGSAWTVQFAWNDLTNPADSVTTAVETLSANPTTDNLIGFAEIPPATGTITDFSLTAVPEPATLGLFVIGGVGLLLIGRKRAAHRSA